MLCPQLTQKLGSSEDFGCFSLMPAADASWGQQAMQHPTLNEDKLIREVTEGGEIKAAPCLEERNTKEQLPTRERTCGTLGTRWQNSTLSPHRAPG